MSIGGGGLHKERDRLIQQVRSLTPHHWGPQHNAGLLC